MDNKLSIITVNFNTPEYIFALNHSLRKYNTWYKQPIIVYDNSITKELKEIKTEQLDIRYVDNAIYKDIDSLPKSKYAVAGNYNSARHAKTIDMMLNNISTPYCLLVDSDIIFKMDFKKIVDDFITNNYFLMGYRRTTYKKPCIAPWCCFINIKQYTNKKLSFFDFNRILYINDNLDYDTGASLYEDAISNGLQIKETQDNTFYTHFKGGSVFKNKGILWLKQNLNIWF